MVRRLIIAVTLALCVAGLSCVTPVIPLPPPPLSSMSFAITGPSGDQIVLSCKAPGGAPGYGGHYVFVLNDTAKKITMALAKADGSFTTDPLLAHDGDQVWIWAAASPGNEGDTVCGRLRFATGSLSQDCTY